ncbi:hypothetical protein Tco_0144393 [Tanacetum coccineum]
MDEPEPHPAYDFFEPGPLPGYASNPNNMNGWIEADVPLLGELDEIGEPLGAEVDESMVDLMIDEIAEPIVEVEEQMVAPVVDREEDLAVLFGDDEDSGDDDSKGPEEDKEVWEVNEEWLMAPVTPPPMPVMPPPSTYEVGGPSTAAAEGHSLTLLAPGVPKVVTVSDAEVADSIAIGEIGPRVSVVEVQVQTLQAAVQHRDMQIQQLQTLVAEMSSRDGTLMQCILGMDRRLADLERRPPGPQ